MDWLTRWLADAPASSYRLPATNAANLTVQRIPRLIVQAVKNRERDRLALTTREQRWADSWRLLNPEYLYVLLDDDDCRRFVHEHGSELERRAYGSVITGAQRADLFRILFLRSVGGIWADRRTVTPTG